MNGPIHVLFVDVELITMVHKIAKKLANCSAMSKGRLQGAVIQGTACFKIADTNHVADVFESTVGNKTKAAKIQGVDRKILRKKIRPPPGSHLKG